MGRRKYVLSALLLLEEEIKVSSILRSYRRLPEPLVEEGFTSRTPKPLKRSPVQLLKD
jgi:hypothetical protein